MIQINILKKSNPAESGFLAALRNQIKRGDEINYKIEKDLDIFIPLKLKVVENGDTIQAVAEVESLPDLSDLDHPIGYIFKSLGWDHIEDLLRNRRVILMTVTAR